MKEKLLLLREDLEKSIQARNKTSKSYFSEELMILRVNELLEVLENENKN